MTPEYLYKYRPLDLHALYTISRSELYFSSPMDFNDPFDCNIVPDPSYTNEEAENYIKTIQGLDHAHRLDKAIDTFRNRGMISFYETMVRDIERLRNELRICSLSEINNSIMMFSHYADGHRGLCFEFRVDDSNFFDALDSVKYPPDFPKFHPFRDDRHNQLVQAEFLTKSPDWSYEREWRIIKAAPQPALYRIPDKALTGIIFGCQTSEENKQLVNAINAGRQYPAALRVAYKIDKSFSLGVKPFAL
jgi:hypothetical protein